jgi:hypothetical protein
MSRIFGFSRNAVALVGILVAIVLVVLVGLIIVGNAAIGAMMTPGAKAEGISLLALLVTIIVLLTACFIVLLVLLRCCCRRDGGKRGELPPDLLAVLLPMLPTLRQLPNHISDLGVAIYQAGKTLSWMQGNIDAGAQTLKEAARILGEPGAASIPVLRTYQDAGVWLVDPRPQSTVLKNPLENLLGTLQSLGANLAPDQPPASIPVAYAGATDATMAKVSKDLVTAGKALVRLAHELHADRMPPAELLQP